VLRRIACKTTASESTRWHIFEFYYYDLLENDWRLLLCWDGDVLGATLKNNTIILDTPVITNRPRFRVITRKLNGNQDGYVNVHLLTYFALPEDQ
jgi:hypothetical protein